ncbi:hypothetical protein ACIQCR_17365 [Streptomyces sp. NPDC093249]
MAEVAPPPGTGDGRLRGAALGGAGGVVNETLRELALTLPGEC